MIWHFDKPKLDWEFFFGRNPLKPLKDLVYGYVPEGYDQQAEEQAFRSRQNRTNNEGVPFTTNAQKFYDTNDSDYNGA